VRQVGIEALAAFRPQRLHQREQHRETRNQRQPQRQAAAMEGPRQRSGPGQPLPAVLPDLGQHGGDVHRELVRRCVLAGVIAAAAVVAEIGELGDVAVGEGPLRLIAGNTAQ
jgi:hypothetical protein